MGPIVSMFYVCFPLLFLHSMLLLLLSHFSCVQLCATPQTAACQALPSLGFSRQDTGVGCHFLLQCMKVKSESEVAQYRPYLIKILLITANVASVLQTQSPISQPQTRRKKRRSEQFRFVHIIKNWYSLDKNLWCSSITQAKLLFPQKAGLEPPPPHLWKTVPAFSSQYNRCPVWTGHRGSPLTLLFMDFYNSRE